MPPSTETTGAEVDIERVESFQIARLGSRKKRLAERACQPCRYRKKRCDGVHSPAVRCTHCKFYNFECVFTDDPNSYIEPPKRLGSAGYAGALEERLRKVESYMKQLGIDVNSVLLDQPTSSSDATPEVGPVDDFMRTRFVCDTSCPGFGPGLPQQPSQAGGLAVKIEQLVDDPTRLRFIGESGETSFIGQALEMRGRNDQSRNNDKKPYLTSPGKWSPPPWEVAAFSASTRMWNGKRYVFPDSELIPTLVDLYFKHVNLYNPLLHRPTFDEAVSRKLHLLDFEFATVFLLVCATGSQFCDDPRTYLDPEEPLSAGWQWFEQVSLAHSAFLAVPNIYRIQSYCLSIVYLHNTSALQSAWTLAGIGLRMAQDVGAHRRDVYSEKPCFGDESWKRAFWLLVFYDRYSSLCMGRQCAMKNEDLDIDPPAECDDEYWSMSDPDLAFKQPEGKPSIMSCFAAICRLALIMGDVLRQLTPPNFKPVLGSARMRSSVESVTLVDSALNEWLDNLPDYLKWDATRQNAEFFGQSALLHSIYSTVKIMVHRTLIPTKRRPGPVRIPCLAICANAARSAANILDTCSSRNHHSPAMLIHTAFTAGVVLLLSIWGSKRSGFAVDYAKTMADVGKCMRFLVDNEDTVYISGRFGDHLRDLMALETGVVPSKNEPSCLPRRPVPYSDPKGAPLFPYDTDTGCGRRDPLDGTERTSANVDGAASEPSTTPSESAPPTTQRSPTTVELNAVPTETLNDNRSNAAAREWTTQGLLEVPVPHVPTSDMNTEGFWTWTDSMDTWAEYIDAFSDFHVPGVQSAGGGDDHLSILS